MADQFEREPVVDDIINKIRKRITTARWLFSMIDGTNRMLDISKALVDGQVKKNENTANYQLHYIVRDINDVGMRHLGEPLIVKETTMSPYSCNASAVAHFVHVRSVLLPMDMSSVEPTAFMSASEAEKYQRSAQGYDDFVELARSTEGQLSGSQPKADQIITIGQESFAYPNASLARLIASCLTDSIDVDQTLTKEQRDHLQLNSATGPAVNMRTMAMVNAPLFIMTPSQADKGRFDYQLCGLTFEKLQAIACEVAKLPQIDDSFEALEIYQTALRNVNDFMNGNTRDLGFTSELGIGASLMLRNQLSKFEHDNPSVILRRNQLVIMLSKHLAAWNVYTDGDRRVIRFSSTLKKSLAKRPAGGACSGLDAELFFPERGESTRDAKEVCAGCAVREECLEAALINGEKFGIWGGHSERERRRLRRRMNEAKKAANATSVVGANESNDGDEESDEDELESA